MFPTNESYIDVILPLALRQTYTYKATGEVLSDIAIGKRVVVQFGKKKIYSALVLNIHQNAPTEYEVKEIISVIDKKPVVNSIQLEFWNWIANYYMCTLGEVMKAALPSGLKLESETKVIFNPEFTDFSSLETTERLIWEFLSNRNNATIQELMTLSNKKNILPQLKSLLDQKVILMEEVLKESYKPKTEKFIKINPDINNEKQLNEIFDSLGRAPKQLELVMKYIQLSGFMIKEKTAEVKRANLLSDTKASSAALKSLIDKGVFESYEKEVSRLQLTESEKKGEFDLSPEQATALDEIRNHFTEKNTVLLHGVTSSGKTQLYIRLIEEQLSLGKQVLYLLPEIALTTQIIQRLKLHFGDKVGIYHSKYSDAERVEVYNNILHSETKQKKQFDIILGVRSSVFLPYSNLGLIIIDEEHENTYKQYDPAPRYNARDSAMVLANLHKAKVLLGSATPSFESYFNTISEKYGLVELKKRYQNIKMPEILLVDTFRARRRKQMKSHFTNELIDKMEEALRNGEQIILFQNRRGFSPYVECNTCGWIPKCTQCDVLLTYHKYNNDLVCHYCGHTIRIPHQCSACGSQHIETRGFGTEKIEEEIGLLLPDAKVARMDLDSTRAKNAYERLIQGFENKEIDILIGTQMISKGLDFDNVSLVGILNADNLLNRPDFRAFERSYQLLAQVSGRAGRKNKQGKVIIQTSQADHSVLEYVLDNEYNLLFNSQLLERKNFKYPPYFRMISFTIKHKKQEVANQAAELFTQSIKQKLGLRVLGPQKPLISRIQNYYIKNVVIKVERELSIAKVKSYLLDQIAFVQSKPAFRSVIILPDVDPQ